MAKNLIPEIAKMLGVELGEEFKIKGYDGLLYKLTNNGLELTTVDGQKTKWFDHGALNSLLKGKMEIIKLPWKPKMYETYYYFDIIYGVLVVCSNKWTGLPYQYALLAKGWALRTKEEARAALPAVAKEMGVDYKL